MKKNRLIFLIGITFIILAGVGFFARDWIVVKFYEYKVKQALSSNDRIVLNEPEEIEVGAVAPDFQLDTLNGNQFQLSDHRGKVVVLNFWTTWCPPCKKEMPHLQNFYEQNKERPITVVAVNLTSQDHGFVEIEEFVHEFGLTFPIPLDYYGEVGSLYASYAIPTSYIINRDGMIVYKHTGPVDEDLLKQWIEPLLEK